MDDISVSDLSGSDRQKLAAIAREAGCSVESITLAVISAYLHLLDAADYTLPARAPGVSLKRMGGK